MLCRYLDSYHFELQDFNDFFYLNEFLEVFLEARNWACTNDYFITHLHLMYGKVPLVTCHDYREDKPLLVIQKLILSSLFNYMGSKRDTDMSLWDIEK